MCSIWCAACPRPARPCRTASPAGCYHETEGLPLFLAAYLEALAQGGEAEKAASGLCPAA